MYLCLTGLHCPTDDAFILMFLRARKFDYDRAYDLICNYYTIRAKNKDIFDVSLDRLTISQTD